MDRIRICFVDYDNLLFFYLRYNKKKFGDYCRCKKPENQKSNIIPPSKDGGF